MLAIAIIAVLSIPLSLFVFLMKMEQIMREIVSLVKEGQISGGDPVRIVEARMALEKQKMELQAETNRKKAQRLEESLRM